MNRSRPAPRMYRSLASALLPLAALLCLLPAEATAGENAIRPASRPASRASGEAAPGNSEGIFSRENSLMAIFRCRNLESVDRKIEGLLKQVHPGSAVRQPLKYLFGTAVFNDGLRSIHPTTWIEAVLFSLPLESDNDWVYVMRSTGEKNYLEPLLELGTIRREVTEDSITRLRQTRDEVLSTFFVTFTRSDLILIGRCKAAVERARKLYLSSPDDGLFPGFDADLWLSFHLNRYLLAKPRALNDLADEIQKDVVRDLAGSQYKQDNPLNLALNRGLQSLCELAREAAVADLSLDFPDQTLRADVRLSGRYGGSLHYALTNLPPGVESPAAVLPAATTALTGGILWPEQYGQFLDGIAKAVTAIFGKALPSEAAKAGAEFSRLLRECGPESFACGLVRPATASSTSGPSYVTVIRWRNPEKLSALWNRGVDLLTIGPLSELLAEHGIKFEITTDQEHPAAAGWKVDRTTLTCRSTYFTMPGVLAHPQTFLSIREGQHLVLAVAAAPLSVDQLRAQEPAMLEQLAGVLARLPAGTQGGVANGQIPGLPLSSGAATPAAPGMTPALLAPFRGALWYASANPLAVVQTAFLSEAVWPQPAEPNRLPVPWQAFSDEFARFPAVAPPLQLILGGTPERLHLRLTLPYATLAETAAACLNFSVPAPKE